VQLGIYPRRYTIRAGQRLSQVASRECYHR
jgi:hypothetical protein